MWLATLFASLLAASAADFPTPAEASDFRQTPRLAETLDWYARLAGTGQCPLRISRFGRSPQGRVLPLLVLGDPLPESPEQALASGKPILLIQAGIHPGENEGKDAQMAFVRSLCFDPTQRKRLESVVLLLIPVFNVDGHERFSPFHRINQNGPEEMGWRATATNLNLNRDFLKADAPEMRAWHRLWQRWRPHLLVDMHNTNGADYQYPLTWAYEREPNLEPALARWQRATYERRIAPAMEKRGFPLARYVQLEDPTDLRRGLRDGPSTPRFSTGYAAIANRAGLLLETHMLKDFRTRTAVNVALLEELLAAVAAEPKALVRAVAEAEAATVARASHAEASVPVRFRLGEAVRVVDFLGVAYERVDSELSGSTWVRYDPERPERWRVPMRDAIEVEHAITPPAAYLLPPQWREVTRALRRHGVVFERLASETEVEGGRDRFTRVAWAPRPYEGRVMVTDLEGHEERVRQTAPAGSLLVPLAQPNANLAIHLLEPQAPDSLLRWGFFHAIFEEKEYAEPRVLEEMGREMLAADPELAATFARRLAEDAAFAADPTARLRFFYERSPYFDREWMRYPVLRLGADELERLRALVRKPPEGRRKAEGSSGGGQAGPRTPGRGRRKPPTPTDAAP